MQLYRIVLSVTRCRLDYCSYCMTSISSSLKERERERDPITYGAIVTTELFNFVMFKGQNELKLLAFTN